MGIHDRIRNFDFSVANSHDLAVLLEQVFLSADPRCRDAGPLMTAQNVLELFEAAIRQRAAPELHAKTKAQLQELRSTLVQFETSLRQLEQAASQRHR